MKKLLVFCLLFVFLAGCGEKKSIEQDFKTVHDFEAVKEKADLAMAIVNDMRNSFSQMEIILRYQEYIDFLLNDPTASRLDDAEVQLAYLTEAFRDLYSQVKDIRLIPFVQQAQKTAPRPSGFTVSTATQTLGGDEYALYSRGLDAYRKKFYDESRQFMMEIINSFPNGKYLDRAYYWIAESFVEQKNFKQALDNYQKVLTFKGSSKEDDAQYRIGICYLFLNEFDKAIEELTILILKYPGSEFVGRAKDAINRAVQRRNQETAVIEIPQPAVSSTPRENQDTSVAPTVVSDTSDTSKTTPPEIEVDPIEIETTDLDTKDVKTETKKGKKAKK